MSDMDKQKLNEETLPFFVRYLEEQSCQELTEEESTSVRGGYSLGTITTLKYPSDNEDIGGGGGGVTTLKYPSDNEDAYSFTFR